MAKKLTEDQIKWILSLDVTQAEEGYHKLRQENKKLEERNKEVKKSLRDLEKAGKSESDAFKKLSDELNANNQKLASNREMVKKLSLQMGLTNMTMVQLKRHAQDLQRQLDNTSEALHPEEYAKLNQQLLATRERMAELKGAGKNIEADFGKVIKSQGTMAAFLGNVYTKVAEWGVQMLAKGREFMRESLNMAASAEGVQRAFSALDRPELLANLREATKGTVNNLELMKAAVKAKDFRIPLEDLGKYLQFAQLKAQQTGQSVEFMTESIVTGLGRKSLLILDNLGLSAAEINEEVAKTGDFMKGVASIVDKQLAAAGEKFVTTADRAQQRAVLLQNIQLSLGQRMQSLAGFWESAWTGVLKVVDKFVSIPVEDKIRIERQEINRLATAVMSANSHADVRQRLIRELNQKYPKFLQNMDTEKLTNEQLAIRLREVNQEYGNKIRIQVMNDKVLAPMQEKERKLTEEQIELYKNMSWAVQNLGQYMSRPFIDAIKNGTVVKMSAQEINAELEKMEKNGVSKSLTRYSSGLEGSITRLKEIPSELQKIHAETEKTITTINNMQMVNDSGDGGSTPEPQKDLIAEKKKEIEIAEASVATTREEVMAKNRKVQALKEELEVLQNLGIEKAKYNPDPNSVALKNMESAHAAEMNEIRLSGQKKQQAEEDINFTILQAEQAYYTKRISKLEEFKLNEKKASRQAEYQKQIVDSKSKLIGIEASMEEQRIAAIERLRQEELQKEEATTKAQQIYYAKELAERKITQEQYEMLMLSLTSSSSEMRYAIEERYLNDINDLELKNGKLKTEAVKKANQAVLDAEQNAINARTALQAKMNDLVKDFKSQFKLTTVDEDLESQIKALDAAYEARKQIAEKQNLDTTELDAAHERAKEKLVLDSEHRINQIRNQYGLLSQKEQFDLELQQLKEHLAAQVLTHEEYEKAVQNLKRESYKKQFDYYSGLFSGAVNALQQAEMANIDAKYDAEIEAAQGNAEEVERLEQEKAQKKLNIEKKYADVDFAVKASQIIADTAVAIMKAFATLGPIAGPIAAALMGTTGAAQLAAANAERKKIKSMTLSGSDNSSSGNSTRVPGRQSGGKLDVTRAQDGKFFPATDYDPARRGFVDRPTVIVGEGPAGRSREWIASNDAVSNPTIAPFLNILDQAQQAGTIRTLDLNQVIRARMAGFSAGGSVSPAPSGGASPVAPAADGKVETAISRLCDVINRLEEEGLPAYTLLDEFDRARKLKERSRKIGSKS